MAVGTKSFPEMHPVAGFRLGTASAGIKNPGRKDLVVMELAAGSTVAGVFTKNAFCAAPVQVAREHLSQGEVSYLVTNTGNANAGTGNQGLVDARTVCHALADISGVSVASVLPFSTGVIGELLPVDKIVDALPNAVADLREDGWALAAEGILTTDTRAKGASRQLELEGKTVNITGISKGSGMIKPNMATMLAYVATDAEMAEQSLQELVSEAANLSFNRITVDGDTSTNDSAILVATGAAGVDIASLADKDAELFRQTVIDVFIELAQLIIKDGEGATKFISVQVEQGASPEECASVAFTVAESPLVKTALFASDPNWGRILAAIGRSGVDDLDVNGVSVYLDQVLIAEQGGRAASYTEEQGQRVMDQQQLCIRICLGRGDSEATVWTTDLSYDYVKINAEYRT